MAKVDQKKPGLFQSLRNWFKRLRENISFLFLNKRIKESLYEQARLANEAQEKADTERRKEISEAQIEQYKRKYLNQDILRDPALLQDNLFELALNSLKDGNLDYKITLNDNNILSVKVISEHDGPELKEVVCTLLDKNQQSIALGSITVSNVDQAIVQSDLNEMIFSMKERNAAYETQQETARKEKEEKDQKKELALSNYKELAQKFANNPYLLSGAELIAMTRLVVEGQLDKEDEKKFSRNIRIKTLDDRDIVITSKYNKESKQVVSFIQDKNNENKEISEEQLDEILTHAKYIQHLILPSIVHEISATPIIVPEYRGSLHDIQTKIQDALALSSTIPNEIAEMSPELLQSQDIEKLTKFYNVIALEPTIVHQISHADKTVQKYLDKQNITNTQEIEKLTNLALRDAYINRLQTYAQENNLSDQASLNKYIDIQKQTMLNENTSITERDINILKSETLAQNAFYGVNNHFAQVLNIFTEDQHRNMNFLIPDIDKNNLLPSILQTTELTNILKLSLGENMVMKTGSLDYHYVNSLNIDPDDRITAAVVVNHYNYVHKLQEYIQTYNIKTPEILQFVEDETRDYYQAYLETYSQYDPGFMTEISKGTYNNTNIIECTVNELQTFNMQVPDRSEETVEDWFESAKEKTHHHENIDHDHIENQQER